MEWIKKPNNWIIKHLASTTFINIWVYLYQKLQASFQIKKIDLKLKDSQTTGVFFIIEIDIGFKSITFTT